MNTQKKPSVLKAGTTFVCLECGKTFKKSVSPKTVDIVCPKCKSVDVEILD